MKPVPLPFYFSESSPHDTHQYELVHRAKWVVVDPWTVLENGYLHISFGTIVAVGSGSAPKNVPVVDHGAVALMPACVNAHTHLELCALKGLVPCGQGFRTWVKELIKKRDALGIKVLRNAALSGMKDIVTEGCRLVGDISTLGITFDLLQQEALFGICFHEYLGNSDIPLASIPLNNEFLKTGLAAHAPHTTSPLLLRKIKQTSNNNDALMSIHVAESEDELSFITSGTGPWADFLTQRNIDFSRWPLPTESPVAYLAKLGILDNLTLAVHLILVDQKDIDILKQHQVRVCLCPRSNDTLHHRLPDIERLIKSGFEPCLGTDSLASAPSLSILDEMSFVASNFQGLSPETIVAMGTVYGASALGFGDRFGTLRPGYAGATISIPITCQRKKEVVEAIIRH